MVVALLPGEEPVRVGWNSVMSHRNKRLVAVMMVVMVSCDKLAAALTG